MKNKSTMLIIMFVLAIVTNMSSTYLFAFEKVSAEQIKSKNNQKYETVISSGGRFVTSADGRTVALIWYPSDLEKDPNRRVLVSLHGHGSMVTDEFPIWKPYLEKYHIGLVALQWWDLGNETASKDYLRPNDMYIMIDRYLRDQGIKPGRGILHGFSRGATNTYPVMTFDVETKNRFFGACISNAGGLNEDYPPNRMLLDKSTNPHYLDGTHWIMYGSDIDKSDATHSGSEVMLGSQKKIESMGGTVDLFLRDNQYGHGGFHRNPANVEQAMKVVDKLIPH